MGHSAGAMLILAVILMAMMMFASLFLVVNAAQNEAIMETSELQREMLMTGIAVSSTGVNYTTIGSGRCATHVANFDTQVENTGDLAISDFDEMDVFFDYTSNAGGDVGVRPEYISRDVSDGRWTVEDITPSTFETSTWDSGDTATIRARLQLPPDEGSLGYVRVSTPNGVVASAYMDFDYVAGANDCRYLHNNPTQPVGDTSRQEDGLPMDTTVPTATSTVPFYNYDVDVSPGEPGRSIAKFGSGPDEIDPGQFQSWRSGPLASPLTLSGTLSIDIWGATQGFTSGQLGIVTFFFRDYDGAIYTEIGEGTIFDADWQSTSTDWVRKVVLVPGFDYTIPASNQLEVKMIVENSGASEMWFAYDTSDRQSLVNLSFLEPIFSNVFYLHNTPTPPVASTTAQAVLPMDQTPPSATTLYDYDQPDGDPGRTLQPTNKGVGETNLNKYQVWRTAPLASPLTIDGDATLDIYAASANFTDDQLGILTGYLRDYDPGGTVMTRSATRQPTQTTGRTARPTSSKGRCLSRRSTTPLWPAISSSSSWWSSNSPAWATCGSPTTPCPTLPHTSSCRDGERLEEP